MVEMTVVVELRADPVKSDTADQAPEFSLSSFLNIFPTLLFGSSLRKYTCLGTL